MPDMPPPPKGIVPHLTCKGAAEAIAFYVKALGAVEMYRHPHTDGRLMHASLKVGDAALFLADDFPEFCGGKSKTPLALGGAGITLHMYVPDCDAAVKRAADAGARVTMPPADMFWGDRYGQVTDPYGYVWAFATPIQKT